MLGRRKTTSMISRILKFRPLLWVAAILLLSYMVSFTWERHTSYDDGGVGTISFLIITLFSAPGEFFGFGFGSSVFLALASLIFADVLIGLKIRDRSHGRS
jgi:hypothetical protein